MFFCEQYIYFVFNIQLPFIEPCIKSFMYVLTTSKPTDYGHMRNAFEKMIQLCRLIINGEKRMCTHFLGKTIAKYEILFVENPENISLEERISSTRRISVVLEHMDIVEHVPSEKLLYIYDCLKRTNFDTADEELWCYNVSSYTFIFIHMAMQFVRTQDSQYRPQYIVDNLQNFYKNLQTFLTPSQPNLAVSILYCNGVENALNILILIYRLLLEFYN